MNLFLTGTDTNVGKTYVAALLIRALRRQGHDTVGMKPICCGDRADAEALYEAGDRRASLSAVNPVWMRAPAAPFAASLIENRAVDLSLIRETFANLRKSHSSLIVEGVGGWRVPITADFFVSDLAAEFGLPVAIVVANRLGALNHALLTIEAVRREGLEIAGIILNHVTELSEEPDVASSTNRTILEALGKVPILWEIDHGQDEITLERR